MFGVRILAEKRAANKMTGQRRGRGRRPAAGGAVRAVSRDPFANLRSMAAETPKISAADKDITACCVGFDTTALKIPTDNVPVTFGGAGGLADAYVAGVLQKPLTLANLDQLEFVGTLAGVGKEIIVTDPSETTVNVNASSMTNANTTIVDGGATEYQLYWTAAGPANGALRERKDYGLRVPFSATGAPLQLRPSGYNSNTGGKKAFGSATEPTWTGKVSSQYSVLTVNVATDASVVPSSTIGLNNTSGGLSAGVLTTAPGGLEGEIIGAVPTAGGTLSLYTAHKTSTPTKTAVQKLAALNPIVILKLVDVSGANISRIVSVVAVASEKIDYSSDNGNAAATAVQTDTFANGSVPYQYFVFRNVGGNLYPMEINGSAVVRSYPSTQAERPVYTIASADLALGSFAIAESTELRYGTPSSGLVTKVGYNVGSVFTELQFPDPDSHGSPKFDLSEFIGYAKDFAAGTHSKRAYDVALALKAAGVPKVFCCVPGLPALSTDAAAYAAEAGITFVLPTSYNISEVFLQMKDAGRRNLIYVAGEEEMSGDHLYIKTMPLFELRSAAVKDCIRQFSIWSAGDNGYSPTLVSPGDVGVRTSIGAACLLSTGGAAQLQGLLAAVTAPAFVTGDSTKLKTIGSASTATIGVNISTSVQTTLKVSRFLELNGIMKAAVTSQFNTNTTSGCLQEAVAVSTTDVNFALSARGNTRGAFAVLYGETANRVYGSKTGAAICGDAMDLDSVTVLGDLSRSDAFEDFYVTFQPFKLRIVPGSNANGVRVVISEIMDKVKTELDAHLGDTANDGLMAVFSRKGGNAAAVLDLLAHPGVEGYVSGLTGKTLDQYATKVAEAGKVAVFSKTEISMALSTPGGYVTKQKKYVSVETVDPASATAVFGAASLSVTASSFNPSS